jgi:O-methyltransferase
MAEQIHASEALLDYARTVTLREDNLLRELRRETADLPGGTAMQVMAEEGQLLELLVRLTAARLVVEVGTFTGYSTLCLARGLAPDGRVITLDVTGRWPEIGADYWRRAGVAERIDLRIGDARQTMAALGDDPGPGSVDLVFIDADKTGYPDYYEHALHLVRPGGLIIVDNTLFFGRVADDTADDPDTRAVRALNATMHTDERIDLAMLLMADGITLARRR